MKAWICRAQGSAWKDLRLKRLLRGLRFSVKIGDRNVCEIIKREIRHVLLKN